MIQRLSHASLYVLDQDSAKRFYTEKLGFDVKEDQTMDDFGGFRWLTVTPPAQPDLELILMPIEPGPMLDPERAEKLRDLVAAGTFGGGALETDDCHATYEELRAKGVEFMGEPQERPYGIEALLKDDSGNWFSMVERPRA
jgi:catechol 2,3-dioxygenase-like lactoylglutathione lyase family enzyme